jgi:aminoglycoside phosphotransferase (APT) family kinase protein
VDVCLEDGTALPLLFKDIGWHALEAGARRAKPAFLHHPLREIEVYRTLLAAAGLGTATYWGAAVDEPSGRYWLFLERVAATALYQMGEVEVWQQAARWLARLHARFAAEAGRPEFGQGARLLRYDRDSYWLWLRRAHGFLCGAGSVWQGARRDGFERLANRYGAVVERLLGLPVTLIHGEFYASNVLVRGTPGGLRICPVDWEMAAVAPGLLDLAALTAGRWTAQQKTALALAYRDALAAEGFPRPPVDDFLTALALCRLHLAVQWLGWSPGWRPPAEHTQDWLGEALGLAQGLELC